MELFKNFTLPLLSSSEEYENNIKLRYKLTEEDYNYQILTIDKILRIGYINKGIRDTGSYIFVINSDKEGGATGIFCTSKSKKSEKGTVNKLVVKDGKFNEILDVEWEPYEYPKLILRIHKLNKEYIKNKHEIYFSYNVKVI